MRSLKDILAMKIHTKQPQLQQKHVLQKFRVYSFNDNWPTKRYIEILSLSHMLVPEISSTKVVQVTTFSLR